MPGMSTEVATVPAQPAQTPPAQPQTPILDGVIEGMAWLVLGIAPLLINVYNVDAYRTIQATYTSLFIVVMAAAWTIGVTLTGRWGEIRRLPFLMPLAVFAVLSLGFLFTSSSVPVSGSSWVNYILYCLFFLILSDMGARKRGFVWRLTIPLFFAFAFNCVTGLLQHKAFLFLGNERAGQFTGLYQYWPFKTSGAANYFAGLQAPSRLTSAAGTLGNQNVLGGYLSATIPLFAVLPAIVVASWRNLTDWLLRRYKTMSEATANLLVGLLAFVLAINAVVSVAALLATDTRGAWLGVAASILVGMAVVPAFFKEQLARLSRGTWLKIALGAVVALVAMGGLAYSSGVTPRMLHEKIMNTWTIKQRLEAWKVAYYMANEKPLFGQGLGTYKINYFKYLAKSNEGGAIPVYMRHRYVQAHNDFIQLAAEVGYIGLAFALAVLIAFWASIPRYIWRRRPPPHVGLLLMGVLLGSIGMSVFAISGFPFHIAASSAAWVAISAMAGAYLWRERREAFLAERAEAPAPAGGALPLEARWALTGAICVFSLSLMFFIYLPFRADELTKEGMEAYKQGRVAEAGRALQQAIQFDPERGDARLVWGIVLASQGAQLKEMGRVEDGIRYLNEAVNQFTRSQTSYDDVTLHYYLGVVYEKLGQVPLARNEYLKALSYFPEGTDVRRVVKERLAVLDGKSTRAPAAVPAQARRAT